MTATAWSTEHEKGNHFDSGHSADYYGESTGDDLGLCIWSLIMGILIGVALTTLVATATRADKWVDELPRKPGEVHHNQ